MSAVSANARALLRRAPRLLRRETWSRANLRAGWAAAKRHPRRTAAGVLLVLGALVLVRQLVHNPLGHIPTAVAQQGALKVAIVEAGTLQALRSVTYASTIQSNQAKIVAVAPEGKMVKKGDLLILFDAAPFEEEIRRSQAQLEQARADFEKARQDVKLQALANQEELATARQKVSRSELELLDVRQGKGRVKEEEALAAVATAERDRQKARTAYEDLKPLLAEGFITKLELERAEQQVEQASEELALAKKRRDALVEFGRPLEVLQAESDAKLTRDSLRQMASAVAFKMEQKRAATAGAESRIHEAASKLELARQQLARCEVRADVPGIVVYRDVFFGSDHRKPQVGDQVWANQPLLILPDISKMVVETKVRETDVHKLEKNQRVQVRVEAYPDLKLSGKVILIGSLAQEERERPRTKFFGVTVEVNESDTHLRPGMSARVEIEVEERRNAVFIPLEAVFDKNGLAYCYVISRRGIVGREIVLGPSNRDFVVVEKGLRKGEQVALRDPEATLPAASGEPDV